MDVGGQKILMLFLMSEKGKSFKVNIMSIALVNEIVSVKTRKQEA